MNFARKGTILVLIPLIVGVSTIAILSVLLFKTDRLGTEEARRYLILETSDQVICSLYDSVRALMLYGFYNRNTSFLDTYNDNLRKADESIQSLDKLISGRESEAKARAKLENWRKVHLSGKQFLMSSMAEVQKNSISDRLSLTGALTLEMRDRMQALQREVDTLIYHELDQRNEFLKVAFGESRGYSGEMENAKQMVWLAIIIGVGVNIVVTLSIASFFSRSVVKRIQVLTDNSIRMAAGLPLNPRLSGQDELARLDSTFHQMSDALEGAARKERATITNAADVIASLDQKLRFTAVNPAALKVWGYTADELIGRGVMDLAVADDAETAYGQFKALAQNQSKDAVFEMRLRHKDGAIVHTSWSVDWSLQEQSYFCVAHDITERILAESLLKESEARTRHIIESLPIGLLIVTEEGTVEVINRKVEQLVGKKESELLGLQIKDLFKTEGATGNYVDLFYGLDRNMQMEMIRSDGSYFPVEVSLSEIFFRGEKRFLLVMADITERKELEKLKSDFVAMVSHDLRTPLTTLHGNFELLSRGIGGKLDDKGKKIIEVSEQETRRLINLINNLLDVERLESGKMAMSKEVGDISLIVSQAVNSVGYLAEKSGIRIVDESESIETFADSASLVQVMVNLLANAIKFSPSGSSITVSAMETPHFIEVSITDQGRGIPKAALETVFDRFKQVEVSDRTEKGGSGLGLAICKAIIEAHGGIIGVDSQEGKGTTFYWRLPIEND